MQIEIQGRQRHPFGQAIQKMDHNVLNSGLFSDARLLQALDNHPENLMDIYAQGSSQACLRGSTASAALLEAARLGALWIKLRMPADLDTSHGQLAAKMHQTFSKRMKVKTSERSSSLVISSPQARMGYTVGTEDLALWHLRGRKRIYIYPNRAPYIRPRHIQGMALKLGTDTIPYKREFESEVIAIDLEPGEVICWPHLSPYRIDNLDDLNVSMHSECMTMASKLRMGSHYFDGFVNRVLRTHRAPGIAGPVTALSKTAAAAIIQKTGIAKTRRISQQPRFIVNLAHPGFLERI